MKVEDIVRKIYTESACATGWLLPAKLLQCVGLAFTVLTIIISLTLLLGVTEEHLARVNRITCFIAGKYVSALSLLDVHNDISIRRVI